MEKILENENRHQQCIRKQVIHQLTHQSQPVVDVKTEDRMSGLYTGMHHITTFRSTTDCIYDGGPIRM